MANPKDMNHEGQLQGSTRLPPLAQAGLAALVAGSLLVFSALAFNTAFEGVKSTEVTANAPQTDTARPVVLPATPSPAPKPAPAPDEATAAVATTVAVDEASVGDTSVGVASDVPTLTPPAGRDGTKVPPGQERRLAGRDGFAQAADTHYDKGKGRGHIKARGNGHHKERDHHGDPRAATSSHQKSQKSHGKNHGKSHGKSRGHGRKAGGR